MRNCHPILLIVTGVLLSTLPSAVVATDDSDLEQAARNARDPYSYRANVQWYRNHHMRLEFPTLFGFPVNVRLLTRDLKNTGASFFGIGNHTKIDDERIEREPPSACAW